MIYIYLMVIPVVCDDQQYGWFGSLVPSPIIFFTGTTVSPALSFLFRFWPTCSGMFILSSSCEKVTTGSGLQVSTDSEHWKTDFNSARMPYREAGKKGLLNLRTTFKCISSRKTILSYELEGMEWNGYK